MIDILCCLIYTIPTVTEKEQLNALTEVKNMLNNMTNISTK